MISMNVVILNTNTLQRVLKSHNDLVAAIPLMDPSSFLVNVVPQPMFDLNDMKLSSGEYHTPLGETFTVMDPYRIHQPESFDPWFNFGKAILAYTNKDVLLQDWNLNLHWIETLDDTLLSNYNDQDWKSNLHWIETMNEDDDILLPQYKEKSYGFQSWHNQFHYFRFLAFAYATLWVIPKYADKSSLEPAKNKLANILSNVRPEQIGNCPYLMAFRSILCNWLLDSKPLDQGYLPKLDDNFNFTPYNGPVIYDCWLTHKFIRQCANH